MKLLIAITSCARDRAAQQAQRDTWIKDIPAGVDYRFFLGQPAPAEAAPDEVFLSAPDSYTALTYKTKGLLEWSQEHGYDFTYKTDVDTLVVPANLLSSGFENYDYTGGLNTWFASGGSGYCLSAKAAGYITALNVQDGPEDVLVAQTMKNNGIQLHDDPRFMYAPGSQLDTDTVSFHLSSVYGWGKHYVPSMMFTAYEKQKNISAPPIVSVICPTADRPHLIPIAIKCFLDQDFSASEMVILDDGVVPTIVPYNGRIKYVRMEGVKLSTGAKRNACCEIARGNIICHFDDDDWSAPTRISQQVARLDTKAVTEYTSCSFYHTDRKIASQRTGSYGSGASYCYRKDFWKSNKFIDIQVGEDSAFYHAALSANQIDDCDGRNVLVCLRHGANTWGVGNMGNEVPLISLPSAFRKAMGIEEYVETTKVVSIPHAHHGYCRKHKALGCAECSLTNDY
jgi:hypothetical protein